VYKSETRRRQVSPLLPVDVSFQRIAIRDPRTVKDLAAVSPEKFFSPPLAGRPADPDRADKSCRINNAIRTLNHICAPDGIKSLAPEL